VGQASRLSGATGVSPVAPLPATLKQPLTLRSPRRGRKPAHWTRIDRDYETLRIGMQTLFHDLGIATQDAAAA